jgi:two-component system, OmpR family, aerobic respiration control sensor histidine kinase ArcB
MTAAPAPELARDLDDARLTALLDLAGPEVSAELARRLVSDFATVAVALQTPGSAADLGVIRAQSHILIGLAGTIGAGPLAEAALRLNRLAHHGDPAALALARTEVLALMDRLQPRLAAVLSMRGAQP